MPRKEVAFRRVSKVPPGSRQNVQKLMFESLPSGSTAGVLRQRAMFLLGGVMTGIASYLFAVLADWAQLGFGWVGGHSTTAALIWTPVGFAISTFLAQRFLPGSSGSGIPQCIAALGAKDGGLRNRALSARMAVGKIGLTAFGLLCGASIGREGPTVQIGASVMLQMGKLFHREQKGLILAGAAAGIAAAFNAPLAGIVFAIEELSRSYESKTSGLILTATILAGLTATALGGNYSYFGYVSGGISSPLEWTGLIIVALAGGLLGGLFGRSVVAISTSQRFRSMAGRTRVGFAFACGTVVSACGWLSGGATYGTGYAAAYASLHEQTSEAWAFVPLKMLATAISSLSGIPGGLFSPSLSVGAGIGSAVSQLLWNANSPQLALLGMAAYLTGVVQSPITAVVIMAEMTDNHRMVVPLLGCALLADWVSKQIQPTGVYHGLAANFTTAKS